VTEPDRVPGDGRPPTATFHRYGPWVLVGAVLVAVIGVELARRHVLNRYDVLFFLALVPTVVLHEVSHGLVAYWCGDDTAKRAGRLSLNPLRHIDLFGTIIVPIILILTTGSAFGWAKPVPVDVRRLRHPRNQAVLVGLAGPFVNIVLALLAGFGVRLLTSNGATLPVFGGIDAWPAGIAFLYELGAVNAIIAVFNLIPIPPLDGSAVLERLLPKALVPGYYRLRSAMIVFVIALVLLAPQSLSSLFGWALRVWSHAVFFA
jgi:Zn-dependent protease